MEKPNFDIYHDLKSILLELRMLCDRYPTAELLHLKNEVERLSEPIIKANKPTKTLTELAQEFRAKHPDFGKTC